MENIDSIEFSCTNCQRAWIVSPVAGHESRVAKTRRPRRNGLRGLMNSGYVERAD